MVGIEIDGRAAGTKRKLSRVGAKGDPGSRGSVLPKGPVACSSLPITGDWLSAPVAVMLLMGSYLVPLSFTAAGISLSVTRCVLLAFFVPSLVRVVRHGVGARFPDGLVMAHVGWVFMTLCLHHGFESGLKSGGSYLVEVGGAYLMARAYVLNRTSFGSTAKLLAGVVVILAPLLLLECLSGRNVFGSVFWHIEPVHGERRFGVCRAQGPFEHAILAGVFCASVIAVTWFASAVPRRAHRARRWILAVIEVTATATSVSSGALAMAAVQGVLIMWDVVTRTIRSRWLLLTTLLGAGVMVVAIGSGRSPLRVAAHYAAFNQQTSYYRLAVFDVCLENVWRHPVVGVGLQDWARPEWMASTSIDSMWLVLMTRHGIPAVALYLTAIIYVLVRVGANPPAGSTLEVRKAWMFVMVGFCIAAVTVHLWGVLATHLNFMLGCGVWMLQDKPGNGKWDGHNGVERAAGQSLPAGRGRLSRGLIRRADRVVTAR